VERILRLPYRLGNVVSRELGNGQMRSFGAWPVLSLASRKGCVYGRKQSPTRSRSHIDCGANAYGIWGEFSQHTDVATEEEICGHT
jgi:hypothetical protein